MKEEIYWEGSRLLTILISRNININILGGIKVANYIDIP